MGYELRLACGVIVRGPAADIEAFVPALEDLIARYPSLRVLRREVTDRRLWLNAGASPEAGP